MKSIDIVSKIVAREGEAKASPSKGIQSINLSDYLLKSVWDKVFEVRTDSQGAEYIFGKLPMVTQYGITMYSGDGVDIPSLASGLPFDGRTIWYNPDTQQIEVIGGTGGGSGEGVSNFWDLSGIPSWITNSKPKYTYSEIEGTPDLTKYALVSQIPSLSGYATELWVTKQNYATKATTLSGYGITDAYTKTNVDDLLKSYVTLGGTQTITGEKNFTGGLKVNGSPIYYDTEKKYWKLEGDLLVTGGVTMYGSDSSFTPSTIMDAIAVDGVTISKSGGVLKVIGGTGGGVADSVAWANITGKPTFATVATSGKYSDLSGTPSSLPASDVYSWAKSATKPTYTWSEITSKPTWIGSSKPTYSYSEITGAISTTELQNYLTQNSYLNVTGGDNRYLKLSGGTLTDLLTLQYSNPRIAFKTSSNEVFGSLGIFSGKFALYTNSDNKYNDIIHSGNYQNYALPLSGGTITGPIQVGSFTSFGVAGENFYLGSPSYPLLIRSNGDAKLNGNTIWHSGNDGSGSGLDADLLDGQEETTFAKWKSGIASSGEHRHIGYAYGSNGWITSGAAMSFGASKDYFMQIQGGGSKNKDVILYARYIYEGIYSDWKTIAFTDSNVASATQVMMNYSYNQDVNYPLVFTSRDNIGVAQNAALYIDFSGRPTYNPKTDTLTVGNLSGNATYATNSSKLYSTDIIYSYGSKNPYYGYLTFNQTYGEWDFKVSPNTPEYIHVYSSDKLRTARTIWGQSFDGTSDVNGNILLGVGSDYVIGTGYSSSDKRTFNNITIGNSTSGIVYNGGTWTGSTSFNAHTFITGASSNALVINNSGNVGIGTASPSAKLHVSGDILSTGAMTFYSMRKLKNVVDERGLSLSELSAIKPTRYTWKDGRDNRLHFGGIADDIQQVLPEVVYKTSEGILTMDYGNAAFAIASSLIKPVVDHEKRIAMLQERIDELEEEVERLKSA